MKMGLGLMLLLFGPSLPAQPAVPGLPDPVLTVEFSNPGLTPARWSLLLHPDGSAHFHSEPGKSTAALHTIEPGPIDRDLQLSPEFADRVFETVHRRRLFAEGCDSHLKVAFQGWKKIAYSGPDGQGTCEFNYSKNKDIESLGDSFVAVASTIVEGARLELLLQHDPLGLDKEMEYLQEGAADGRLQQIGAIQAILSRLIEDPDVMERVRKRARLLLLAAAK
jgi:hypothetical protein